MPRRVQDIIPANRRSIREVPADEPKEEVRPKAALRREKEKEKESEDDSQKIKIHRVAPPPPIVFDSEPQKKKKGRGRSRVIITLLVIIALVGVAGYFASMYFSRAVFTFKPREVPVAVNSTIIATAAPLNGSLVYELVSVTNSASSTVRATVGEYTETKAKGTVTFYNSFSNKPWRLIAGTRFETEDGLVYRLGSTITIPGFSTSAGGTFNPGSITAQLVADQAGDEYNLVRNDPLQKLRAVAYKGDPKYETVYAKITGNVSGGFKGNKVTVSPALLASTTADLQNSIIRESMAHLKTIVPDGYILYDKAYTTSFLPASVNSQGNTPVVSVRGTVYGILFRKSDLVAKIAGQTIVDSFGKLPYETPGFENLSFAVSNAKDFSAAKKNNLIVQMKGSMKLVGSVPVDEMKARLVGLALSDTEKVIRTYAPIINLEKSSGQVVPPWSRVPTDPDKISIIIQD